MSLKQFFIGRAIGFIVVLLVVIAFFAVTNYMYPANSANLPNLQNLPNLPGSPELSGPPNYTPYRTTLTGTQVCLPHKNTSGPQTLECAIGMKADSGEYYALDFNLMSQTPPNIPSGARFTASGVITPVENLSSDHWQKYNMKGIFSVTDAVVVEPVPTVPAPKESATGKCYMGGCSSQLCTGQPDAMSTCEYREEYACYKTATCERQATGKCGWTETAELNACLSGR